MSKFYVTTSIPYVNGEPHLGHAMEFVMGDVLARYHRSQKEEVLFSTGTDEHGSKVAEQAAVAKLTPHQFANKISQSFRELQKELNISCDRFIRTTDKAHVERAQLVWKTLAKAGHIYKGTYIGWYCVGCETFYPEQMVKDNKGTCPEHNRPYEKLQEENYFFKLTAFNEPIKQAIETDDFKVIPKIRKNEIMAIINKGLEDISVSRPKDKINWGISVPGDTNQVMYVWFEALLNYITVLGYPEHEDFKKYWPADMQIVGKDILRFHAAIWPGILLALGLPLPKSLYVHGFINIDGHKMSKSLKNYVVPREIIKKYSPDTFRYFFLRHIPSYGDGDFNWQRIDEAYNSELADQLGNAVQRTIVMVQKYQEGVIGNIPDSEHDSSRYREAIGQCHFDRALEEVWERVRGLNQYIDEEKPWQLAKMQDSEHLREVLAYQVGCLLEIADLLAPFMPDTAAKIRLIFKEGIIRPQSTSLFPKTDSHAVHHTAIKKSL